MAQHGLEVAPSMVEVATGVRSRDAANLRVKAARPEFSVTSILGNQSEALGLDSEAETMRALEAAGAGTFCWDIEANRIKWDAGLDRIFGLPASKTNRSQGEFVALVHPEDRPELIAQWERCRSQGEDFGLEFRIVGSDGDTRWFYGRGKTIMKDGRPICLTGACFDITGRKNVELRRESKILAHMSHELRSPLTSMLAYADILLGCLQDADAIAYVKTIKQGGNHLLELIGDILDLSKIESGKLKIKREIVCLPSLLREVHSLMKVRAQKKNLSLLLQRLGELPDKIETDRTRLRQILFNLVSNAIKFTEKGCVKIVARTLGDTSLLEIEVIDTGIGIPSEQQARLFQPFMQADGATSRGQEGTGLGLAITKQLIELLGGEISFESAPDRGSAFRIRMPIIRSRANEAGNGAAGVRERRKGKILLVDDNQMVCQAVGRLLEMAGHEVALAFSGQSALEKAREFQADAAVLDLKLPDMGGYELLARLKRLDTFQNTKSIALTGYGQDYCQNEGVQFDHFLTKPVDTKELENLLL